LQHLGPQRKFFAYHAIFLQSKAPYVTESTLSHQQDSFRSALGGKKALRAKVSNKRQEHELPVKPQQNPDMVCWFGMLDLLKWGLVSPRGGELYRTEHRRKQRLAEDGVVFPVYRVVWKKRMGSDSRHEMTRCACKGSLLCKRASCALGARSKAHRERTCTEHE